MRALDLRVHAVANYIETMGPKLVAETSTWFRGKPPSIHFRLIDDEKKFGAQSMHVGGDGYRVNVYIGSPRLLELFFNEALSNPYAFPDIGDPSLETARGQLMERIHWHWDDFLQEPYGALELRAPKCPKRATMAEEYISAALCVLLLHEIVHVLNGHVALAAEILRGESKPLTEEERIALEWDADCCAVTRILSHLDRKVAGTTDPVEYFYGLFAEASYAMNLIKPEPEGVPSTFYAGSHGRQHAFLASLATHRNERALQRDDEAWRTKVIERLNQGPATIEVAKAVLVGGDPRARVQDFKTFIEQKGMAEYVARARGWNAIRPRLQPLAYVTLAPEHADIITE